MSDARRLKVLEAENARLKKLLAETILKNEVTKEAQKKWYPRQRSVSWCGGRGREDCRRDAAWRLSG